MEYALARVGVDPVICTIADGRLRVLLGRREKPPFQGRHELPGGLVRASETAEEALRRKLRDVIGTAAAYFAQFRTFTEPGRDPRARTISIGYVALVGGHGPGRDWFDIARLPPLAFDHKAIIGEAHRWLRANLGSEVVRHFLPGRFPLNRLQEVHEAITGERYDNRNFRRKMLAMGVVIETGEREEAVSHRPAVLHRFRR
jgi:8-oxo-dGTP diphosphatase